MNRLSKWLQTIKISISKQTAYKTNFVFLVIGPSVVFFFIKYNLWTAIYAAQDTTRIGGYNLASMLRYQLWTLVVAMFAQSYNAINLSEDIRLGRISAYMIYPFDFWQYHTASFIGGLLIQFFVACVTIFTFYYTTTLNELNFTGLYQGFSIMILVAFLWYLISYTMGLLAFWLDETWVFRVIFVTIASFFSGSLLPIEVFPSWLATGVMYTPFPYLTWAPAKAFMNELPMPLWQCYGVLLLWLGVAFAGAQYTWSRGVKMYTAAGM